MRFLEAFFAMFIWTIIIVYLTGKGAMGEISMDVQFLSLAIVVGGALAGGD